MGDEALTTRMRVVRWLAGVRAAEGKAAAAEAAEEGAVPAGIPDFWMIALRNSLEEGEVRGGCGVCLGDPGGSDGALRRREGECVRCGWLPPILMRCSPPRFLLYRRRRTAAKQINDKDAEVLCYCTDIRCERFYSEDGDDGEPDEVRRAVAMLGRRRCTTCWAAVGPLE